jgi:hypothetical protein
MRNVSEKPVQNIKTHSFMFNDFFFENRAVYEMWKNILEPDRPMMTTQRMPIPCWIPKVTNIL